MNLLARTFHKYLPLLLLPGLCQSALGHPMGNFSVNHYSRITLESDRIRIRYLIDLAEIPTYQELQQANIRATAMDPNSTAVIRYIAEKGVELGKGLTLEVNGKPALLHLVSSGVIFPPGAGGLLRYLARCRAHLSSALPHPIRARHRHAHGGLGRAQRIGEGNWRFGAGSTDANCPQLRGSSAADCDGAAGATHTAQRIAH